MRFRKGSKVEVLSKAATTGSWLCAEIISGSGHTYSVKYGWCPAASEGVVHRVPRRAIRPCPPPLERERNWIPGDLGEVFDDLFWKTAVVVKVFDGDCFSVRLVGSSSELVVPKSHLRVRQCWEDGRWFVIGEGKRKTAEATKLSSGNGEMEKSEMISARTLKRRRSIGLSDFEDRSGTDKKIRLSGEDGSSNSSLVLHPSPASEKVDAFVPQHKVLGKTDMPASFRDKTAISVRVDVSRENNTTDTDSCASSVGSCSYPWNDDNRSLSCARENNFEKLEDYSSDAESHCGREYVGVPSSSTDVELGTDIRRSELHAYRCALWALYASGPMSWEEEEKLVDLRCALNISNDEHLLELGNLKCAHSRIPLSC